MMRIAFGSQLRAAESALGWSPESLAEHSGISIRTLVLYEDVEEIPPTRSGNLEKVVETLEAAGIEFIGTPDDRPGIRIGTPAPEAPKP